VQHALKRDVPAAPPTHDAQERWRELELKRRNLDLERRPLELNDEIEASPNPKAIAAELSPELLTQVSRPDQEMETTANDAKRAVAETKIEVEARDRRAAGDRIHAGITTAITELRASMIDLCLEIGVSHRSGFDLIERWQRDGIDLDVCWLSIMQSIQVSVRLKRSLAELDRRVREQNAWFLEYVKECAAQPRGESQASPAASEVEPDGVDAAEPVEATVASVPVGGWFPFHRGWFGHPLLRSLDEVAAWAWLIGQAAREPQRRRVCGCVVDIQRGQLAASKSYIATAWKWSETRVRRFLVRLATGLPPGPFGGPLIKTDIGPRITVITVLHYVEIHEGRLPGGPPKRRSNGPPTDRASGPQSDHERTQSNKEEQGDKEEHGDNKSFYSSETKNVVVGKQQGARAREAAYRHDEGELRSKVEPNGTAERGRDSEKSRKRTVEQRPLTELQQVIRAAFADAHDHVPKDLKPKQPRMPSDLEDVRGWPAHWHPYLLWLIAKRKLAAGLRNGTPVHRAKYLHQVGEELYRMICRAVGRGSSAAIRPGRRRPSTARAVLLRAASSMS